MKQETERGGVLPEMEGIDVPSALLDDEPLWAPWPRASQDTSSASRSA
jgi:hypothetical protein